MGKIHDDNVTPNKDYIARLQEVGYPVAYGVRKSSYKKVTCNAVLAGQSTGFALD